MRTRTLSLWLLSCLFAAVVLAQAEKSIDGKAAFDRLKSLAGEWHGTGHGPDNHEGTVTYRVSSGGHSVIETLWAGTDHEMVSVFFLSGSDLAMTHYCSAGNQPHMRLETKVSTPDHLVFIFAGGTNLHPTRDAHVHSGSITISAGHLEEHWLGYANGEPAGDEVFQLTKVR